MAIASKHNDEKKKLVSCIVPVLNEEETISNFIISLCRQDYRPIELIIVDGGSKDNTVEIVTSFSLKGNEKSIQIKLLKEDDFGSIASPANARNVGLNSARGEFVFFIDSDTCFIEESTISTAISEIGNQNFILIGFRPLIDTKLEKYISRTIEHGGILLYKKNFIEKVRFIPTLGFGEDREFNYRLFGNFNISSYSVISNAFIGRHFPHTKTELKKQSEWYGRTILKYLYTVYTIDKKEFFNQLAYVVYNVLMAIYPVIVILSLFISPKLTLTILLILFVLIMFRFCKRGVNSIEEFIFLVWYSIFCGIFFSKGLISNIYKKNIIGRF